MNKENCSPNKIKHGFYVKPLVYTSLKTIRQQQLGCDFVCPAAHFETQDFLWEFVMEW
jgi:hypothetical protein